MQVDQGSYLWKDKSFILEIPLLTENQNLTTYIIIKSFLNIKNSTY